MISCSSITFLLQDCFHDIRWLSSFVVSRSWSTTPSAFFILFIIVSWFCIQFIWVMSITVPVKADVPHANKDCLLWFKKLDLYFRDYSLTLMIFVLFFILLLFVTIFWIFCDQSLESWSEVSFDYCCLLPFIWFPLRVDSNLTLCLRCEPMASTCIQGF